MDYINSHSVRRTLMLLGLYMCATREELKAWSQYLGHEKLDTPLVHYAKLDTNRQNDLMQSLARTDLTVGDPAPVTEETGLRSGYPHAGPAAVSQDAPAEADGRRPAPEFAGVDVDGAREAKYPHTSSQGHWPPTATSFSFPDPWDDGPWRPGHCSRSARANWSTSGLAR
jgi:hypothetical protein